MCGSKTYCSHFHACREPFKASFLLQPTNRWILNKFHFTFTSEWISLTHFSQLWVSDSPFGYQIWMLSWAQVTFTRFHSGTPSVVRTSLNLCHTAVVTMVTACAPRHSVHLVICPNAVCIGQVGLQHVSSSFLTRQNVNTTQHMPMCHSNVLPPSPLPEVPARCTN